MRTYAIICALLFVFPVLVRAETNLVYISEVAWSGSSRSDSDEWLELTNRSAETIDLTGWKIQGAASNGSALTLPALSIEAQASIVIANYDLGYAKTVLTVKPAYVTSSVSLPNTDLVLVLTDASGAVMDQLSSRYAGSTGATRASMERVALGDNESAWASASTAQNLVATGVDYGTPGLARTLKEESALQTTPAPPVAPENLAPELTPLPDGTTQLPAYVPERILVSEIGFNNHGAPWIELWNANSYSLSLANWTLVADNLRFMLDGRLERGGYRTFNISSATGILELHAGDGTLVDKIQFPEFDDSKDPFIRVGSYGLSSASWKRTPVATPGAANMLAEIVAPKKSSPNTGGSSTSLPKIINAAASFKIDGPDQLYVGQQGLFGTDPAPSESALKRYEWRVDDRVSGTASSLLHVFDRIGSVEISLTVADGDKRETARHVVDVRAWPATPNSVALASATSPVKTSNGKTASVPRTSSRTAKSRSGMGVQGVVSGVLIAAPGMISKRSLYLEDGTELYLSKGSWPPLQIGSTIRAYGKPSPSIEHRLILASANQLSATKSETSETSASEWAEVEPDQTGILIHYQGSIVKGARGTLTLEGDNGDLALTAPKSETGKTLGDGDEIEATGILLRKGEQTTLVARNWDDLKIIKRFEPEILVAGSRERQNPLCAIATGLSIAMLSALGTLLLSRLAKLHATRVQTKEKLEYEIE